MKWINEREVPNELTELLDNPETPKGLWKEIVKARDEINDYGAVTYPTKARVEALYHEYMVVKGNL